MAKQGKVANSSGSANGSERAKLGPIFIDFLFALAATQVFLELGDRPNEISKAGLAHLGLALLIIVLSYIGYHNERISKGNGWNITFFNREFFQFIIDIAIVTAYFVLVLYAEGRPGHPGTHGTSPSAVPEAVTVAVVFLLYVVWDFFEVSISKSQKSPDGVARARYHRQLSLVFVVLFAIGALVVSVANPTQQSTVIAIDAILAVPLVFYRVLGAKHWLGSAIWRHAHGR